MRFIGARRSLIKPRPVVLAPSGTALPLQGNIAFHLSADSITGLGGGASLTTASWKDSVNNIAIDTQTGTAPTFQTNVIGGKPSVRFTGASNGGFMSISTPGALKTAIDSATYTVLIACKTSSGGGQGGFNGIFGSSPSGGNSFFFLSDTYAAGRYTGGYGASVPYAGTSFFSLGEIANPALPSSGNGGAGGAELFMLNGTAYFTDTTSGPGSGGGTFNVGNALGSPGGTSGYAWSGDLFEILVWNVALSPAQYMQAEMWLREKYSQPYAWASISKMPVFFGDSISAGVGTTSVSGNCAVIYGPAYLTAQSLGLQLGQYQALAIGGLAMDQMASLAPTYVNPIAAQIGKRIGVISFEWANQKDSTTTAGAAMLAALKATPNIQTVFGTSTDGSQSGYEGSARDSYDAAWDAVWAGAKTNVDSYMSLHTDPHIGVDGSYATYSGTTGGDSVHLTNATYPYLAALMTAGFNALPP